MRKIGNFAVRTIDYIFVFLITVILLSAIVAFSEWVSEGSLKYVLIVFSLIIVACFVIFGEKILKKLYYIRDIINDFSALKLGVILFCFVLITKVFFVFLFNNDANLHPDMKMYLSFATQFADKGMITEYSSYASRFSYTVVYGLFLSPIVKVFGSDTKVLTAFLSFLFSVISVLLFDIVKPYVGKNKAFTGLFLFNAFPVGLFETQLLIHETALLFFYITSFWLLTKCLDNRFNIVLRIFAILFSAVLIGFGNKINRGGTVVIISYCIYILIVTVKEKITLKKILKCGYSIVCYIICFVVLSNMCTAFVNSHIKINKADSEEITKSVNYRVPYAWGFYLGLNPDYAGKWNDEDRDTYEKYHEFDNKEDAQNYIKGLVSDRLQFFKDNPLLIPGHLFKKIKNLWGRPQLTFAYEEGNCINDFVLYGAHGIIYKAILGLSYWVFILLCSLILFSHKRHKNINLDSLYTPVTQFKLMIIGLTLALFLFEVTPKYVCHMQIIMFCIGVFSFSGFMDNSLRINSNLKKLKNKYIKG